MRPTPRVTGTRGDWIVDVVNEYSIATREAAGELSDTPELNEHTRVRTTGINTGDLITVADAWFDVFQAAPNPEDVCALLNRLLDQGGARVSAATDDHHVISSLAYLPGATEVEQLAALGAAELLDVVADIGVARLGLCSADHCVDVYIDRSPRRNKRYCSTLCQTRERVKRHRNQRSRRPQHHERTPQ